MAPSTVATLLLGLAALLFGRQAFWLLVGAAGFGLGFLLAAEYLTGQPDWVALAIAAAAGLLGVLMVRLIRVVAVGLGGFAAGAYATLWLMRTLEVERAVAVWGATLVGGVLGTMLALVLVEWGVIVASSLTGAALLIQPATLTPLGATAAFCVLVAAGIAFQASRLNRAPRSPTRPARR